MAKRIIPVHPALPITRYPLSNGAVARQFSLGGPLPRGVLNGAVQLQPYANFGPTPGFNRLGLKPVRPPRAPPEE